MKYPTINSVDPTKDYSKGADTKTLFGVIADGIYQIFEGEKVHMAKDYSREELDKFVESLDVEIVVLHEGAVLTRGNMNSIKKNKQVIDVYLGR